jgi:hypothetical protein
MAGNEFSMTRVQGRPKQERELSNMKNRNIQLKAMLFVVALAIAPIFQAAAQSDGTDATPPDQGPVVTIHTTDNVTRGTHISIRAEHKICRPKTCNQARWNVREVLRQRHRYPRS